MSRFEEIARQAAAEKAQRDSEARARREEQRRASEEAAAERDRVVNEHVAPLLRSAQKALDAVNIQSALDLDRNAPSMTKVLTIGHSNTPQALMRQTFIRVERDDEHFHITVIGQRDRPSSWQATIADLPAKFEEAYSEAMRRYHS